MIKLYQYTGDLIYHGFFFLQDVTVLHNSALIPRKMQRPLNRNGNGHSYFRGKSLMHILSVDLRLQISERLTSEMRPKGFFCLL